MCRMDSPRRVDPHRRRWTHGDTRLARRPGNASGPARCACAWPTRYADLAHRARAGGVPMTFLRGISLIDERTGADSSVTVSQDGDFRRIHSGDVKIYERTGAGGRAWLVHGVQTAADDDASLALLGDPAFDPRARWCCPMGAIPGRQHASRCRKRVGTDRRVRARTGGDHCRRGQPCGARPGRCLLSGLAGHGGWRPRADLRRANLMFRGLALALAGTKSSSVSPHRLAAGGSHQSHCACGPGRGRQRDRCSPEAQTMTIRTAGTGSETDPRLLRIGFSVLRPSALSRS